MMATKYLINKEEVIIMTFANMDSIYQQPALTALKNVTIDNNVVGQFIGLHMDNPDHPYHGYYFVVCPDSNTLIAIMDDPLRLEKVIKDDQAMPYDCRNPYCYYHCITGVSNDNIVDYFDKVCTDIQICNLVKTSFHECGKPIPAVIMTQEVDVLQDLNIKRYNTSFPPSVRDDYNKTFKKYVDHISTRKIKDKSRYHMGLIDKIRSITGSQVVSLNYFERNCIDIDFIDVNKGLFDYWGKEIKKYPQVKYYHSDGYTSKARDISHDFKGLDKDNHWQNDTALYNYRIGISFDDQPIYIKLFNDYRYQNYSAVKYEDLTRTTKKVVPYHISYNLMDSFDTYCRNKNIKYCIDNDNKIASASLHTPAIGYRAEDEANINNIMSAIMEERKQIRVVNEQQKNAAEKNKPSSRNPYDYLNRM